MRTKTIWALLASLALAGCTVVLDADGYRFTEGSDAAAPDAQTPSDGGDAGPDGTVPGALSIRLEDAVVRIVRGSALNIGFTVSRGGVEGAISVQMLGAPDGLSASPVEVAAGSSEGTLVLEARADAMPTADAAEVRVQATAEGVDPAEATLGIIVADLPTNLDTTFAGDGELTVSIPGDPTALAYASGATLDSAGRLVVVGNTVSSGPTYDGLALRVTPAGELDGSFGVGGFLGSLAAFEPRELRAVVPLGDGVLVGGEGMRGGTDDEGVFALTPSGVLSTSWGDSGFAWFDFQALHGASAAGAYLVDQREVRRVDETGQLDTTFGAGGVLSATFVSASTRDPMSRLLIGSGAVGVNPSVDLTRHVGDGSLDSSFGGSGTVQLRVSEARDASAYVWFVHANEDWVTAVVSVHPSGTPRSDTEYTVVYAFTGDGTPVPGFGSGGQARLRDGPTDLVVLASLLQDDNRLLVVARDRAAAATETRLLRVATDGTLDATFPPFDLDRVTRVVFDPVHGRVYVIRDGYAGELRIARYWL